MFSSSQMTFPRYFSITSYIAVLTVSSITQFPEPVSVFSSGYMNVPVPYCFGTKDRDIADLTFIHYIQDWEPVFFNIKECQLLPIRASNPAECFHVYHLFILIISIILIYMREPIFASRGHFERVSVAWYFFPTENCLVASTLLHMFNLQQIN